MAPQDRKREKEQEQEAQQTTQPPQASPAPYHIASAEQSNTRVKVAIPDNPVAALLLVAAIL